jgi:2-keto-4-pentenoate hydratase
MVQPQPSARELELAALLAQAHETGRPIAVIASNLVPEDAASAYRVQREVLALRREAIAGWKLGAKSDTGPIQGAPLPASGVHPTLSTLKYAGFTTIGLELEIGFLFGKTLHPRDQHLDDAAVMRAIRSMVATIEIVSTRFERWPAVDKLAQLADFQNHGALLVSRPIPFDPGFNFLAPRASFQFNGKELIAGAAANPAGDPRRLLPWLVEHCSKSGITIEAGCVVTTGSYSGMYFAEEAGTATGVIEGLPPVVLTLE